MTDPTTRLAAAIHAESAAVAPQTTELIEAAREALRDMERLRTALQQIADRYIPDQPGTSELSERDWIVRQHVSLRRTAKLALLGGTTDE